MELEEGIIKICSLQNHMTRFCHMRGVKYKTPDLLSSKFFVKDVIKEARIYREI